MPFQVLNVWKSEKNLEISLNPNRVRSVENVASKIVPAGWKRFLWMFLQPRPQVATNHTYCSGKLRALFSIFVGFDIWGYFFFGWIKGSGRCWGCAKFFWIIDNGETWTLPLWRKYCEKNVFLKVRYYFSWEFWIFWENC